MRALLGPDFVTGLLRLRDELRLLNTPLDFNFLEASGIVVSDADDWFRVPNLGKLPQSAAHRVIEAECPRYLVRARPHRTDPGVVLGAAAYMSPEQVRGKTVDHRADVFAFGTILYEMVTGKQPFRKSTSAETMTAILNEEPPSISQITPTAPPGMQRVVHRCLEKDPEQRFHSSHDLAFALEALSDSTITTPSGSQAQQGKGSSRRRITIVGTTLLVLIVASALAYLWLRREPLPKVSNPFKLTNDGQPKYLFGTDGPRLYLRLGNYNSRSVGVIPISGGEPVRIPAPSAKMLAIDLSPDGSQVLVVDQQYTTRGPLWSLPVLGGAPRRLGNIEGQYGAWSSDGKMLACSDGGQLFLARADGTEPRKLVAKESPAISIVFPGRPTTPICGSLFRTE